MGGKLYCEYDEVTGTLKIGENPLFYPEFFDLSESEKTKIKNVTAIVGENGAGKSSLLNYLKELSGSYNHGKSIEAIIVIQENNGDLIVYRHQNCTINYIENSTSIKEFQRLISDLKFEETNFVFYSSVFDQQEVHDSGIGTLRNISTNYLIKEDSRSSNFSKKSEVDVHKTKEMERQVRFVSSVDARYLDKVFELPEELTVSIQHVEIDLMYLEMKNFPATNFFKNLSKELASIEIRNPSRDAYEKHSFMKSLMVRTVQQLFLGILFQNDRLLQDILIKECNRYNKIRRDNLFDKVYIWLSRIRHNLRDRSDSYSFLDGLIKMLDFFDVNIWNGKLKLKGSEVTFPMDGNRELFQKFYKSYIKTIGNTSILELSWRDLSSGEKALLNLYARFYSLVDKHSKIEKNVVVLIDEGELYFHPEWQKRFLLDTLNFLSDIFGGNDVQAIQIILTSNSPFIVSDLPSSHVIFLKKEYGTGSVVVKLHDHQQTFSANIHNLLSHSFFMQNGTIGEFAKQKINNTIDLLINGNIEDIQNNRLKIEYLIKIIGEPIIRNQMISLLEDRLSIMPLNLEERVRSLEKELQVLKLEMNL